MRASTSLFSSLCLLLVFLATLSSSADVEGKPESTLDCYICQNLMAFIDNKVDSNVTEDEVKKLMLDGCKILSPLKNLSQECVILTDEYYSFIPQLLEEELSPDRICDALGVCIVNKTTPNFVHLALTGDPTEMSVSWFTYVDTATSRVFWSKSPVGPFTSVVTGSSSTYLSSSGYTHKAIITGLEPSTEYFYKCGDDDGGFSDIFSFRTHSAEPSPFTIALYGDQGVHNSETTMLRVRELVENRQIDFVYHVGDYSYADDYLPNIYNYVIDQWFGEVEPVTSKVPYMLCPGNHEYSCSIFDPFASCFNYSKNFAAYNSRFDMPGVQSGTNTSMFYSFDYSFVHFVAISTETDYPEAPFPSVFGDQLNWLKADLAKANANRDKIPWIIVVGHRPIYSSGQGFEHNDDPIGSTTRVQAAFEDIFHQYGVDIYISAHVHSYERVFPIFNDQIVSFNYTSPDATVYFVNGAGGCIEGLNPWVYPQPDWTAFRDNTHFGYALMSVFNSTTLRWQFIGSDDNAVLDEIFMTRKL